MRTLNSFKNAIFNMGNNLVVYILKFITRIFFVKFLSDVYLGVNGLLSNVLGILALAELGVGTAIGYSLYEPLLNKDDKKCLSLMAFYKKAYYIIALIVLILGLVLLPFLPWFIKDTSNINNLNIIYLIFLGNMVIGYLFSYKRTLITADQKNYKIVPIISLFNLIIAVSQIISLFVFKDYIVYLIIQVVGTFLENVFVNKFINKNYSYLKDIKNAKKINDKDLKNIKTNILSLMIHKIGSYVLAATDNLVISKLIGIVTVGIYSNYVMIHSAISSFIYSFISNTTSSLGNLIATKDSKKIKDVFREMDFISFALYGVSGICLLFCLNPFIKIVFGAKYLLDFYVVIIIVINYYLVGINQIPKIFQSAAGIYKNDRIVPLFEAIINVIVSVIAAKYLGIVGVLIGTFTSYLLPLFIKPYIVFKHVLKDKYKVYLLNFLKEISMLVGCSILVYIILILFKDCNIYLNLILSFIISLVLPTFIIFIVYRNRDEYINFKNRIMNLVNKVLKRKTV